VVDHVQHAIRADRVERGLRAKNREPLALAQSQKARRGIDLGVGQHDGADWRMAAIAFRVESRRSQDLLAQIDRGVEQQLVFSVNAEGDAHLRARLDPPVAAPGETADATAAVPLRHAAPGA